MYEPPQSQLDAIGRIYRDGAKDLSGLLTTGTAFGKGKATILLKQVDQISRRMGIASDDWVDQAARDSYVGGAKATDRQLERMGFDLGAIGHAELMARFLHVNHGAIDVFARSLGRDLAGANRQLADTGKKIIFRTSQKVLADPEVSQCIAKGLVSGGNLNKIANGLKTRLAVGGRELLAGGKMTPDELKQICDFDAGVIQAGQRRMDIDEYCGMVAGYQLRQAVVQSTKDRLTQQGQDFGEPDLFDLVIVTGPISGDCCDFYVGKIFSISGRSTEYPACSEMLNGGPPFHPNCTHSLAPFVKEFATPKEMERGQINEQFLGIDLKEATRAYNGPDRNYATRRGVISQTIHSSRDDTFVMPKDWGPKGE